MDSHSCQKTNFAIWAIIVTLIMGTIKLYIAIYSGSVGVAAEAVHSVLDVCITIIAYFAVKVGSRKTNKNFHYGYGKVEHLIALINGILLFFVGIWIGYEAILHALKHNHHAYVDMFVISAYIPVFIVSLIMYRISHGVASSSNSIATTSNTIHFLADVFDAVIVLIGVIFAYFGYSYMDIIAAILVAIVILHQAYMLIAKIIVVLANYIPDSVYQEILNTLEENNINDIKDIKAINTGVKYHVYVKTNNKKTTILEKENYIIEVI